MGIGDRLKSLFVIEDDSTGKKKVKESSNTKEKTTGSKKEQRATKKTGTKSTATATETATPGKVSPKFTNVLLAAMDKENIAGFDYLEYKQSLVSLNAMSMDEATRYQSAYAMAKTMGATPEKLLQSANYYLDVLEKEEIKFGQALVTQRSKQVGGRENQIKQLETGIQKKAEKIKQLTAEIEEDQKTLETIQAEISGAVAKVESTKNSFVASYNSLVGQIQKDIGNIKKYLK